ncbi:MAG: phage holin family protein [Muribaculaceae bacterium]|nr:phage holin family protein [Muribaculaceae bacterium]
MTDNPNQYRTLWEQLRRLFNLEVENARFLVTEKLVVLLSSITFYAILAVIITCVTIFLTIGVVNLMLERVEPHWAYMIVAAFYLMLMLILIIFRRQLIINPIARFLSSVILDPPSATPHKNDTPS